jgi:hypothetical protein
MSIFEYIHPTYFFVSFCIGLLMIYVFTPMPDVIIKYPTPDKADKTIFKDDVDNCYHFMAKEIQCPTKKSEILKIPIERKIETFKNKNQIT